MIRKLVSLQFCENGFPYEREQDNPYRDILTFWANCLSIEWDELPDVSAGIDVVLRRCGFLYMELPIDLRKREKKKSKSKRKW